MTGLAAQTVHSTVDRYPHLPTGTPETAADRAACQQVLLQAVTTAVDRGPGSLGLQALGALLSAEIPYYLAYMARHARPDDVRDLTQEALRAVLKTYTRRGIDLHRGADSLRAYTRQACRRILIKHYRTPYRELPVALDETPDAVPFLQGDPPAPDFLAGTEDLSRWVKRVIANLNDRDHAILYAVNQGNVSGRELADLVGVPEAQIGQVKARAARNAVAEFAALWIARGNRVTGSGPAGCDRLTAVLANWDPPVPETFDAFLSARVRRHITNPQCAYCFPEYQTICAQGADHIHHRMRHLPGALPFAAELRSHLRRATHASSGAPGLAPAQSAPRRPPALVSPAASGQPTTAVGVPPVLGPRPLSAFRNRTNLTMMRLHLATASPVGGMPAPAVPRLVTSLVGLVMAGTGLFLLGGSNQAQGATPDAHHRDRVVEAAPSSSAPSNSASAAATPRRSASPSTTPPLAVSAPTTAGRPGTVGSTGTTTAPPSATPVPPPGSPPAPKEPGSPQAGTPTAPPQKPGAPAGNGSSGKAEPSTTYSAVPEMTGGIWRMDFVLNGGPNQPYDITLTRQSDTNCAIAGLPAPCYGGHWYVPPSGTPQAGLFDVNVSLTPSSLVLTGREDDYAAKGPQSYSGTAPNDTSVPLTFTGTWHQATDNATFTLHRLS